MSTAQVLTSARARGLDHRTVWRWHFYAGLFCIPFVLWLATTGTIFLFKPQIERFLDRPYENLSITRAASVNAQVQTALAAVAGSTLDEYQLPRSGTSAAQVLVDKGTQQFRVYIHPQTLAVLKLDNEDHRLENVVKKLHGELFLGDLGSWIVELAASWAVIMILTGLFLWWPRHATGLAGVLYPRLRAGGRTFWKDIHSVTGIYVSFFAFLLLFTGLPWAKGWGAYLKAARHLSVGMAVKQDWTTSSSEALASRAARSNAAGGVDSGMHDMGSMGGQPKKRWGRHAIALSGPDAFVVVDKVVATVAPLNLAWPVLVAPPAIRGGNWTAKSDAQDRTRQVDLQLDPATGAILTRTGFSAKPWLDRVVGTGIAAHEGALFGLANQLLSLFTSIGLVLLSLSGLTMWRKRKPELILGAPVRIRHIRFSFGLVGLMIVLGIYFPFLGASMIAVILVERLVLRRIPAASRWLGLTTLQAAVV